MTTRNEAAERLLHHLTHNQIVREDLNLLTDALAAAKAECAREAVERIRAWATEQTALADEEKRVAPLYEILRILDEEAANAAS